MTARGWLKLQWRRYQLLRLHRDAEWELTRLRELRELLDASVQRARDINQRIAEFTTERT